MRRLTTTLAFAALVLIPLIAKAEHYGGCENNGWIDPVTTHTNGMPLASTTPLRSHHAYYQCDPDRVGCCNGRYNLPCINSLICPDTCCTGNRGAGCAEWGLGSEGAAIEGVETVSVQQLGSVPAPMIAGPGQPAAGAANPSLLNRIGL